MGILDNELQQLKKRAQVQAERRYSSRSDDICRVREALALVREGLRPLLDLEDNQQRKQQRIDRENTSPRVAVERINGSNDLLDVFIIDQLAFLKNAVCRIIADDTPVGSGFLVAEGVILTNHHVVPSAAAAATMLAEFGYAFDQQKKIPPTAKVRLRPDLFFCTSPLEGIAGDPTSGLDFSFVAIEELPEGHTPAELDGTTGKIVVGEQCICIQHPGGSPMKFTGKNTALLKLTDRHLIYESDTLPGSSGSMVVALGTGEIIALHHAGVPKRDAQGNILNKLGEIAPPGASDQEIHWEGNEGIRISCVVTALEQSVLPASMDGIRQRIVRRTGQRRGVSPPAPGETIPLFTPHPVTMDNQPTRTTAGQPAREAWFTLLIRNTADDIRAVNRFLSARYGREVRVLLITPYSAVEGEQELFQFSVPVAGPAADETAQLLRFPEILAAEADEPLYLNTSAKATAAAPASPFESTVKEQVWEDEFSEWNEPEFLGKWEAQLAGIKADTLVDKRRWNQLVTGFAAIKPAEYQALASQHVLIAQLDTGYTSHPKTENGFDLERDYDAVSADRDALDEMPDGRGVLRFPGHGTRTGSLLVGQRSPVADPGPDDHDGNWGLLHECRWKIAPYRIAKTVILLNRQQELAAAVDRAISGGTEVMTMSMGTAPTITTARLAKKAYDAGVIWCCAAGNEVKFVIAPAVFPGTLAVSACNPGLRPWRGSSFGDMVDITAPGEDVLVPIWTKDSQGRIGIDYAYGNGTSYATPHVAAAAALWLARHRNLIESKAGPGEKWKRVEAFRWVLRTTARKVSTLPAGFGAGLLDVRALLDFDVTKIPWAKLEYAYNAWNEQAFLSSLQGWTELFKTYWNMVHGGIRKWFSGESISAAVDIRPLSEFARAQESLLGGGVAALESAGPLSQAEALARLQEINNLLLTNARK